MQRHVTEEIILNLEHSWFRVPDEDEVEYFLEYRFRKHSIPEQGKRLQLYVRGM